MNYSRLISGGGWLLRQLCTAETKPAVADRFGKNLVLYQRLSALPKSGGSVWQTLDQYIMEGRAIRKVELATCVAELRKYRRFQHALEIMEWMAMRKINYTYSDFAVHLNLISKTRGIFEAENYFNGLPLHAKNKLTNGSLLNCYCKEILADKALALFEEMNELNYLTTLDFNNLMSLYMRLGQPEKVPPLVHDLKQRNLPMAAFTYHVWMNSYASLKDIEGVERVYEEMKKEDERLINWRTYSNLGCIYVKAKLFEKADSALKLLEKEVNPWQREPYHWLLSLYAGTSNLAEVYRVWNSLKPVSPVTNTSYRFMLLALDKLNDFEGFKKCFNEWESSNTSYDQRLATIAVGVYLSQDWYEEAAMVFENAINRSKGPFYRIRENFVMYFLKHRQVDVALSHLEAAISEVKGDKWRPSPEVVSAFLKYYEEEKDVDGVEALRKIFKNYNIDHSLLKTYVSADKSIRQILKEDSEMSHELEELQTGVQSE